jgi:two-component system, NarL family, nitrate/nitrite response regulator NarL
MKLRVVIVDDHEIVLQGLRLVLRLEPEVEVVGEATGAAEALQCVTDTKPDLVFLDMELPNSNGILLSRQIFKQHPKTKILIFSAHLNSQYVSEALQAGVCGYLGKIHKSGEIHAALQAVQSGQMYLCSEAATALSKDYRKKSGALSSRLSDREQAVLIAIAEGQSTKEIAAGLSVSIKTVETHRQNIMEKLDLRSVAALTKYAIRQGLARI